LSVRKRKSKRKNRRERKVKTVRRDSGRSGIWGKTGKKEVSVFMPIKEYSVYVSQEPSYDGCKGKTGKYRRGRGEREWERRIALHMIGNVRVGNSKRRIPPKSRLRSTTTDHVP